MLLSLTHAKVQFYLMKLPESNVHSQITSSWMCIYTDCQNDLVMCCGCIHLLYLMCTENALAHYY